MRDLSGGGSASTHRGWLWVPILIMFPLGVGATSRAVTPIMAQHSGYRETFFHVPTLLFPALLLLVLIATHRAWRPPVPTTKLVIMLGVVLTLSMAWGQAFGGKPVSVAYWIQTVIPISAFLLGTRISARPLVVARGVVIGGLIPAALALVFVLMGGFHFALLRLPQFHNLLPLAILVGLVMAAAYFAQIRATSFMFFVVILALLPSLWSHSGLLFGLAAVAVTAFLTANSMPRPDRAPWVMLVGVGAALGAIGVLLVTRMGTIGERYQEATLAQASAKRTDLAAEAIGRIIDRPVFGDAFRPVGFERPGGNLADFEVLFPAENQYLDYALRGGIPALVLLLVIMLGVARRALELSRSDDVDVARFGRASLAILIGVLIVNNFHLYMVLGQTALILWLLMGYVCRLHVTHVAPAKRADRAPAASRSTEAMLLGWSPKA